MKISFHWLKEFVDVPDDAQSLGRKLTNVGLAVDAMESKDSDTVYEFDITTNRPDCLNHLGVAREASAIYGAELRRPTFDLREDGEETENIFSIDIADPDLCGRYSARYIEGVRIAPSPEWLKRRLEVLGLRSINNVADVTNLVMMEIGQPLHAFDADTLHNQQIIVRRAALEEKITTLDGQERTLNPSNLVIADADRPVAIAGVMGGAETEISSRTRNVLLESAYFFPIGIRKTVRTLGLSTEASYRYERGADIEITSFAADRAAALIQQVAGGRICRGVIDVYPVPYKPTAAALRRSRIATFLGAPVPDDAVERILTRLGFRITRTPDGWNAVSPSFRVDVGSEEDLLEEIARHYGFDHFPATLPPFAGFGSGLPFEREERDLRHLLATCGYSETYGLSFSSESVERQFRSEVEPVRLLNPMSEDWTILRTSLVPGILKALEWNLHHGTRDVQLFELGKVYREGGENRALVLAATGALQQKTVHAAERDINFFDIKGDVESILAAFDIDSVTSRDPLPEYYHPGRAARIGDFAVFGELHPDYSESIKPRQRVYLAELEVEKILRARKTRQVVTPPRYPAIRRDLSLLVERNITYAMIEDAVRGAGISELVRVEPFDRLEKGPFPESKYSISISLIYQSGVRTLIDDEVDDFDRQIVDLLARRVGAQLRN
jgi:phenylalanyl-tRNA synthetase beta chain